MILTPEWPAPAGVRAAFTLRSGGISAPPFDSLNLGAHVGDSSVAVAENRRRVRETLCLPGEPVWLRQVHGTTVVQLAGHGTLDAVNAMRVTGAGTGVGMFVEPEADAAVAGRDGSVCAVQVADCMPVLFAAQDGSAVAAAHAGWRGLAAGVLESTIHQLNIVPDRLIAWLGPAIGAAHFEVGDEVRAAFLARKSAAADCGAGDPDVSAAFTANQRGRWQCDLYALARFQLAELGVTSVHGGNWCTSADSARFFSFRRDGRCGRMAALIWIDSGAT